VRAVVLGATRFTAALLESLLREGVPVAAVFTIPEVFSAPYSAEKVRNYNYADLSPIARRQGIPCHEVDAVPGRRLSDYAPVIAGLAPDVLLVLGWYFVVPRAVRAIARHGAWGIHASLLPAYAGHAPLVWAMINGERETGVTLFRLGDGVDDGDVLAQRRFPILFEDTIREVYDRATACSAELLLEAVKHFDPARVRPQGARRAQSCPARSPGDGVIDASKPARELYDFIRAQTRPYPGAFGTVQGEKLTLWSVRLHALGPGDDRPAVGTFFEKGGGLFLRLADGLLEVLCADCGGERDVAGPALRVRLAGRRLDG
jgi:methionyl-tRNA formyltransferase